MAAQSVQIREAQRSELHIVRDLVYELAVYEKAPEALVATLEEYENAFDEKLIEVLVAVYSDKIIGIALYYTTFSTWKGKTLYLEDFYVQPEYRAYGVGKLLFDAFLDKARSLGVRQTKWQVLDWNELGLNFYKKYNANIEKNWWNGVLPIKY